MPFIFYEKRINEQMVAPTNPSLCLCLTFTWKNRLGNVNITRKILGKIYSHVGFCFKKPLASVSSVQLAPIPCRGKYKIWLRNVLISLSRILRSLAQIPSVGFFPSRSFRPSFKPHSPLFLVFIYPPSPRKPFSHLCLPERSRSPLFFKSYTSVKGTAVNG